MLAKWAVKTVYAGDRGTLIMPRDEDEMTVMTSAMIILAY
jgi:hypothetical protein